MSNSNRYEVLSKQTIRRLPYYLKCLQRLDQQDVPYVSAAAVARELGLYEVQVRKEFAAVSSKEGKPGIGFSVPVLLRDIQECLGYANHNKAIVVGTGHLGQALMSYDGFADYGVDIVAGFDVAPQLLGSEINGKKVFPLAQIPPLCQRLRISIGIITVPATAAQEVCDLLVDSGVQAIWNFAPVRLQVPEHVFVQYENMVSSLAILSTYLQNHQQNSDPKESAQ